MRFPRRPIGVAVALMVASLLGACNPSGDQGSARDRDEASDRPEGAEPAKLRWGPVESIAGKAAATNSDATVMAPDGTATVIWVGNRGVMSREGSGGTMEASGGDPGHQGRQRSRGPGRRGQARNRHRGVDAFPLRRRR
jgi:hypothetical protein